MASKWGHGPHARAALRQHAADLLVAVGNGIGPLTPEEQKELADLVIIAELVEVPEDLLTTRRKKFQQMLDLPPLA